MKMILLVLLPTLFSGKSTSSSDELTSRTNLNFGPDIKHCHIEQSSGLCQLNPNELWPTQLSVGKHEIEVKINDFRNLKTKKEKEDFIIKNPAKVVIGPEGKYYIIDKHHQSYALIKNKVPLVFVEIKSNQLDSSEVEFWKWMFSQKYIYPYDNKGVGPFDIPTFLKKISSKKITDLDDDHYRSLAGAAALKGAYAKNDVPFMDFAWANFFREHIKIGSGEEGFERAVEEAVLLAHSNKAKELNLPGFIPNEVDN